MVRCVLIGAPGTGKGTQAETISEFLDVPILGMSRLLKQYAQQKSSLGLSMTEQMNAGQLISDDIIWQVLQEELKGSQYNRGYILDGFPRTIPQAELMQKASIVIDLVLYLEAPDEMIVRRMSGRRIHPDSGRVYHIQHKPPRQDGRDDLTGEPLVLRDDDRSEVVAKRLHLYHEQTEPVVSWLKSNSGKDQQIKKFEPIDAGQAPDQVWQSIHRILQS